MGGQTKGGPRGEFFSFEKKRTHGCCGRLPWLLVPGWQLQWLFLLTFLIVTIFKFLGACQGVFGLFGLILISDVGAGHAFPSLNLMPNAQMCVYLMVHITKLQL
jgi:hypothetical protein